MLASISLYIETFANAFSDRGAKFADRVMETAALIGRALLEDICWK